jgi:tetratricopeptide (TPR) repeat protein
MTLKRTGILAVAMAVCFCAAQAFAQNATVKGTVKDPQGQPMVNAQVIWKNTETGQQYKLKTNKKGEYFSLGIMPGTYNVQLLQDGKEIYHVNGVRASISQDENVVDIDLQKEQAQQQSTMQAAAQGKATPQQQQQLTPEQKKQLEQYQQAMKENQKIKGLNTQLQQAKAAADAGNPDQAATLVKQAAQAEPNRALLWAIAAQYDLDAAAKTTDKNAATPFIQDAVQNFQKTMQLCQADPKQQACTTNEMASYHNNLGQAYLKAGQAQQAMQEYTQAAQLDPAHAGVFYYNVGAMMTNAGKREEANEAFKKAIAADPNYAEAYYQLALNDISDPNKVKVDKAGKTTYPPEAGDNLQKYLQLQPNGKHAQEAQAILQEMGQKVQTTYRAGAKK